MADADHAAALDTAFQTASAPADVDAIPSMSRKYLLLLPTDKEQRHAALALASKLRSSVIHYTEHGMFIEVPVTSNDTEESRVLAQLALVLEERDEMYQG